MDLKQTWRPKRWGCNWGRGQRGTWNEGEWKYKSKRKGTYRAIQVTPQGHVTSPGKVKKRRAWLWELFSRRSEAWLGSSSLPCQMTSESSMVLAFLCPQWGPTLHEEQNEQGFAWGEATRVESSLEIILLGCWWEPTAFKASVLGGARLPSSPGQPWQVGMAANDHILPSLVLCQVLGNNLEKTMQETYPWMEYYSVI